MSFIHQFVMRSTSATTRALRVAGASAAVLLLATACGNDAPAADRSSGASPLTVPRRTPVYAADVVQEYPHDAKAFTQGLLWHDGELYEGTGQEGESSIRRVELRTGRVAQQRDLPRPHFGEGIAILGDKLYQLTWKSQRAFVYDWRTFEPVGEFTYAGEGWGLTTDGSQLIMSDGTPTLRYLNPETFEVVRRVTVTENGSPVRYLNELEWVKGELWANVWTSDQIARIDPESGALIGWIDLKGLLPTSERRGNEDVLNGVAYDAENDRIFVTGKLWSKLYEIRIRQRG